MTPRTAMSLLGQSPRGEAGRRRGQSLSSVQGRLDVGTWETSREEGQERAVMGTQQRVWVERHVSLSSGEEGSWGRAPLSGGARGRGGAPRPPAQWGCCRPRAGRGGETGERGVIQAEKRSRLRKEGWSNCAECCQGLSF